MLEGIAVSCFVICLQCEKLKEAEEEVSARPFGLRASRLPEKRNGCVFSEKHRLARSRDLESPFNDPTFEPRS